MNKPIFILSSRQRQYVDPDGDVYDNRLIEMFVGGTNE